ncbi:MAG: hypothetical protein R3F43_12260 [bacterium]
MSKSGLYAHFASKELLQRDVLDAAAGSWTWCSCRPSSSRGAAAHRGALRPLAPHLGHRGATRAAPSWRRRPTIAPVWSATA